MIGRRLHRPSSVVATLSAECANGHHPRCTSLYCIDTCHPHPDVIHPLPVTSRPPHRPRHLSDETRTSW